MTPRISPCVIRSLSNPPTNMDQTLPLAPHPAADRRATAQPQSTRERRTNQRDFSKQQFGLISLLPIGRQPVRVDFLRPRQARLYCRLPEQISAINVLGGS